jgi:short-subunit dehydrogenase
MAETESFNFYPQMNNFYKNKTVFITGGSSGIGLAIAKAMVTQSCNIGIFSRSMDKLEIAATIIRSKKINEQQEINAYSVDISDPAEAYKILNEAAAEMGAPDILINCVGIAQPDYFENISFEVFDLTLKTNLYATWNSVAALVPLMKKKGGHIVNTSSIAGFLGVFGYTDYCMTKFGIIGFSEALKSEMKRYNIRVSVLCPPDTDTPGFEAENKNKPAETKAIAGNARLLKPEFVAAELLKGIERNKFMIIPGLEGRMTLLLKRFFPSLIEWVMNKNIRKVQTQHE